MKLLHKSLVAAATLGLSLSAFAQTQISVGTQVLLAGWDINLAGQSTTPTAPVQLARYSDILGDALSGNAAIGTMAFNGTGGSDTWAIVSRPSAAGFDIDRPIIGRTLATQLGSLSGNEGYFSITGYAQNTRDEFSMLVHSANSLNTFNNLKLSIWGKDSVAGGDSVSINWGYRTSAAGPTISTGLTSTFSNTGFEESFLDFSAITALNAVTDLYLIGQIVEGATGAASATATLQFDNIAIYGTALTAIPEPSTYAAIMGALVIGVAALRRRRAAALV